MHRLLQLRFWRPGAGLPASWPVVAAGLVGACYYLATWGPRTLQPTYLDWLMTGDRASHLLGWLFFQRAEWAWPIGRIDALVVPVGTQVAFTDSVPWLALAAKLLTFWTDTPFQYSGLWLLGCYALAGVFGALLVRRITPSPWLQLLGATFFVMIPMVLRRSFHLSLSGHYLLLAA